MERHPLNITTNSAHQHALLLQYPQYSTGPRMVMLHGSGVAGEYTWTYLCNYLRGWSEILLLDLAEMGQSRFALDMPWQASSYATQLQELLERLDWQTFDLAAYSFGGMVAWAWMNQHPLDGRLFLLEPAMLGGVEPATLVNKAEAYRQLSHQLMAQPDRLDLYREFLDIVSPVRPDNPQADELTATRLAENPAGFARALNTVATELMQHADEFVQWQAPVSGMSFVGSLSPQEMHQRHQMLAEQNLPSWQYVSIAGADHRLVYTHSRQIAAAMNKMV
ncbi:hypothetical protein CHH28_14980 [Bacterioplanes sanyensis]|uniref:AB hydrolase-1 domain-containing protein n=1 Tax=Bacterioplanes sanyensis TaxID=1249553 RepID=A0A222FMZ9_9GAMM|nr:alpha/beta hydrolase [Bacterioplanes sanyensis]ASP39894.1 hypothetical protein CHH28_14980 [Bacterioplanes sanyensis]